MDSTPKASPARKKARMSDQQGVLPRRPPPRVMGSPGLPPSVPVPGLPGDLLSQQEDFVPGAPSSFGANLSFSSECEFLEAAAHIPPPVSLQELQSAAVPSAALLGEGGGPASHEGHAVAA